MSSFDELDKTFNITPSESTECEILDSDPTELSDNDINADYTITRAHLHKLLTKGQRAIDDMLSVAAESDHPRAYEVAFQGIKNVADVTDKLLDLQKKMKSVTDESPTIPQKGPSTVNNTMFIGSTADLQKFLKQSKINKIEE